MRLNKKFPVLYILPVIIGGLGGINTYLSFYIDFKELVLKPRSAIEDL